MHVSIILLKPLARRYMYCNDIKETSVLSKLGTAREADWSAQLKPISMGGPYNITVVVDEQSAMISDVMFGDVWLCSGQSNMQFSVPQVWIHVILNCILCI